MNPLETILLDDKPASDGIHLYPEQRLSLFEAWWDSLTLEEKEKIASGR